MPPAKPTPPAADILRCLRFKSRVIEVDAAGIEKMRAPVLAAMKSSLWRVLNEHQQPAMGITVEQVESGRLVFKIHGAVMMPDSQLLHLIAVAVADNWPR